MSDITIQLDFDNNQWVSELFGADDHHLKQLEKTLNISASARGGTIALTGKKPALLTAKRTLESLYARLSQGEPILTHEVDAVLALHQCAASSEAATKEIVFQTKKKPILPRTPNQVAYMRTLQRYDMVFATGPAGTGKTFIAVARAVSLLLSHQIERIILSRPTIEAGEKLGFLPGDMKEKVDPYLRPLYDALHDMMPRETIEKAFLHGHIEIAPLAFMRGRTFNHAFVIIDEAQNTTPVQMKMLLTRIGEGTRMVITGDPTQSDLPGHSQSGLTDALHRLHSISDIGFVALKEEDIIRHPLTKQIVKAYSNA